jgi:alpha-tubulin suppressor-like RCC1 family protein
VYVWGTNKFGNLGLGHTKYVARPKLSPYLENIVKVAVGGDHALALDGTSLNTKILIYSSWRGLGNG